MRSHYKNFLGLFQVSGFSKVIFFHRFFPQFQLRPKEDHIGLRCSDPKQLLYLVPTDLNSISRILKQLLLLPRPSLAEANFHSYMVSSIDCMKELLSTGRPSSKVHCGSN